MKTEQTRMDVIGNNIANVSTYGYKASRVSFDDVYYQTQTAASAASPGQGGTNPRQVGYGNKLGSIDVNHSQAVMSSTGYGLDVAITGEGYFQVQDRNGNIFYTKAGVLDFDSDGNLVDKNGNFVLGVSGESFDKPADNKRIRIALPNLDPSPSTASTLVRGKNITITSSLATEMANVSLNFSVSEKLPINQGAIASVSGSSIGVVFNPTEPFDTLDEFQTAVNDAIRQAYGGETPGGDFLFNIDVDTSAAFPLTAADIINSNDAYEPGTSTLPDEWTNAGFKIVDAGTAFGAAAGLEFADPNATPGALANAPLQDTVAASIALDAGTGNITISLGDYSAVLTPAQAERANNLVLKRDPANPNFDDNDSITIAFPARTTMVSRINAGTLPTDDVVLTQSVPSNDLGFGSTTFVLTGGTEGGQQDGSNLSGISVDEQGLITAMHPNFGFVQLGRIDLATFENPKGLEQVGNTYFRETSNSGEPQLAIPGQNGTGSLMASTLETSNVDLSNEFSDMIVTQRSFQANSRIITVSDSMLEELINLKR
jgi:flagellar hook protein FlgE